MITQDEKKLITKLRKNGRQKLKSLAQENGMATSTAAYLVHRMEEKNLLEHKARVSFEQLGFNCRMFLALKAKDKMRNKLLSDISEIPNINTLHAIDSGFDFHLELVFKNHNQAKIFLEDLLDKSLIQKHQAFYVIDTICYERFLTEEKHFAEG